MSTGNLDDLDPESDNLNAWVDRIVALPPLPQVTSPANRPLRLAARARANVPPGNVGAPGNVPPVNVVPPAWGNPSGTGLKAAHRTRGSGRACARANNPQVNVVPPGNVPQVDVVPPGNVPQVDVVPPVDVGAPVNDPPVDVVAPGNVVPQGNVGAPGNVPPGGAPQGPARVLTPAETRRQNKFQVAAPMIKDGKNAENGVDTTLRNLYQGLITKEVLAGTAAAAKMTIGAVPDKTLQEVPKRIRMINSEARTTPLDKSFTDLTNLLNELVIGKQSEAKKVDKAFVQMTREVHQARVDQYRVLIDAVSASINGLNRAKEALERAVGNLCAEVENMTQLAVHGQADALNGRAVVALEKYQDNVWLTPADRTRVTNAVATAKTQLAAAYAAGAQNATPAQDAELLLEFGVATGPGDRAYNEKGKSDSFFLKGPDGALKYVMKPMQGESLTTPDWDPGGGPVREILASKLNGLIATATGLDCRALPTVPVALDDPSLAAGGNLSTDPHRVGSLQAAAPGGGKTFKGFWNESQTPENGRALMARINESDCQAIALRQFLTLDQDSHAGNFLLDDSAGTGAGQTRLIAIDAGQSLPTAGGAKRNAAAMRNFEPPKDNDLWINGPLLAQLPAGTKPFSDAAKDAINALDPTALADSLKAEYDQLVLTHPEMAGKVDPSCFDMIRKSGKFLQLAAARNLTLYEISQVYGEGFEGVADADANGEDAAVQAAVDTALALRQLGGPDGLGGVMGRLKQLGFKVESTSETATYSQAQKKLILENNWTPAEFEQYLENELRTRDLRDIGNYIDDDAPEKAGLDGLVTSHFQGMKLDALKDLKDYKHMGGDPMLNKMMTGNDATYALEVAKPVRTRIETFSRAQTFVYGEYGGPASFLALIGNDMLGKPLDEQIYAARDNLYERRKHT